MVLANPSTKPQRQIAVYKKGIKSNAAELGTPLVQQQSGLT